MSKDWKKLKLDDFEKLKHARCQFHQGIQNVSAVGRKFLDDSSNDENATLKFIPTYYRLAGKWIDSKIRFRSSLGFIDFSVHLVDEHVNSLSSFNLEGKSQGQAMVWLEEQIASFELNRSQLELNLPYELPEYLNGVGKPFHLESQEYAVELGYYFHNAHIILTEVQKAFKSSPVICMPELFDLETRITVNNTGNPVTSTYVRVGFSAGNDEFEWPYFFAAPWPYPPLDQLPKMTNGQWVDEHWVGAILPATTILSADDQYSMCRKFVSECFSALRSLMTY